MPLLLQPLVLPSLTKEASVPLMQRFCTKANVWIAIFSFLGALEWNFSLDCFGWYMELKSAWRFLNEDRICSSVYRSRKTPGVIAQCFDVFWIQWFILSGRLCVDESIRQGHGGTQCHIGPTVASRRLSVWGNYWGTHYFYCVLKAILIWSFWCCWHFFWTNRKLMQMFQTKKFRLATNATICGKLFLIVFNFVAACD